MPDASKDQIIGISWFVLHCVLFAVISIISKKLLESINIAEILFFQTLIGTLILLPVILIRHNGIIKVISYKIHIYRAFFWAAASALFFYSITVISTPKAIAISFAVPLFTTIMAVIFLKETLHYKRIISLVTGFIGMLIIIQPGFENFEAVSLLVVLASFFWSITDIMIKMLSKTHHAFVNTFFFSLFSILFTAPFAFYYWKTPNLNEIVLLLTLGIIFVINIYSVTKAYEKADLTIMMPFTFSQLIFVAILSYLVFGEIISLATIAGSLVIICSTSYIAYKERKKHNEFLSYKLAEEIYDVDLEGNRVVK